MYRKFSDSEVSDFKIVCYTCNAPKIMLNPLILNYRYPSDY